jgi:hypothetical protein
MNIAKTANDEIATGSKKRSLVLLGSLLIFMMSLFPFVMAMNKAISLVSYGLIWIGAWILVAKETKLRLRLLIASLVVLILTAIVPLDFSVVSKGQFGLRWVAMSSQVDVYTPTIGIERDHYSGRHVDTSFGVSPRWIVELSVP